MMYCDVTVNSVDAREIVIDNKELAARLSSPVESIDRGVLNDCIRQLCKAVNCRYAFAFLPICIKDDICMLGDMKLVSSDLARCLQKKPCSKALLLAVTLGDGADRLLARMALKGTAEHFITDACASAMAEGLLQKAVNDLLGEHCPPFSPGYGNLSLSVQKDVLSRLNGSRLGISLDTGLLMHPLKSITAIVGACDCGRER